MSSRAYSADERPSVGFVGAGTVGTALALVLSGAGYPVVAVASRSRTSAERLAAVVDGCRAYASPDEVALSADLVFVTTPDDAIASVAAEVQWRSGQMVVHCSGSLSSVILEPARLRGALVGGMHPLQTFANSRQAAETLAGSAFGVEAEDPRLSGVLTGMVSALGGTVITLRAEDKALYHASAVIACNYLVTLFCAAAELWSAFGVDRDSASRSLLPLVKGTLANLERVGLPGSLTGPVARGDVGTIQKHLDALATAAPELLTVYRELGLRTIPIGLEKGTLSPPAAEKLRGLLGGSEREQ